MHKCIGVHFINKKQIEHASSNGLEFNNSYQQNHLYIENEITNTNIKNHSNNFDCFDVITKSVLEGNVHTWQKSDNSNWRITFNAILLKHFSSLDKE